MKEWCVEVPITGSILVYVEADDEKTAISSALDNVDFRVEAQGEMCEAGEVFEAHRIIAEGNVCHASLNKVKITLENDDTEDDEP